MASSFFLRLLHGVGGSTTFLLFAGISFWAVVFIETAVPETKGKEPQQVAAELLSCESCCPYSELRDVSSAQDNSSGDDHQADVEMNGSSSKWL